MSDDSAGYSWWSGAVNETWRRKGTDVYVVPTSSSVGIGTTQPETALEVVGTVTAERVLGTYWDDILGKPVTEETWIRSGNDMYNANPGNVGVGTTEPAHKFHVSTDVQTDTSTGPSTPLLKCYPPPGLSWSRTDPNNFRNYKAQTGVIQTNLGTYPSAEYACWVNDYDDGEDNGNSTGRVHHVFEDKMNDYRPYKEMDHDTNNTGGEQGPVKTYGTSIYFSCTQAFALKKYLIQAGSWALGNPQAWELYGYPEYYTGGGYDANGLGSPLANGVKLHEVQTRWSTDYADVPFGIFTETMRIDVLQWKTEETFENGRTSRLYEVANNTAFKTYELRFLYVHNIAYRTYFEKAGLIVVPTSIDNDTIKVYMKKQNDTGDVDKYGVSLSQIKFFAEQPVADYVTTLADRGQSFTDARLNGFVVAQTRTHENLWLPRRALHALDAALFDSAATFYGTLCARDVSFTGGKFVMSASSQFLMPAVIIPQEGVSFVAKFVAKGNGTILSLETEYDHTRYFDNMFFWADDYDYNLSVPYFSTFRNGISITNWGAMSQGDKDKIPKLNAPTPNHFLRVSIEAGNTLRVSHFLNDTTALPKNGPQTETPYTVTTPITLNTVSYLCVNITVSNVTIYLSDGKRFRKVAEALTAIKSGAAFNQTPLKLSAIGRSYKNERKGATPDGCPMDLHAFYWLNGIVTSGERNVFHEIFKAGIDENFVGVTQVSEDLRLPLTYYAPEDREFKMAIDGSILGELGVATLKAATVSIGQPDDSLWFAPLHNEGRSYLKSAVGVGALPDPSASLTIGGNVQVGGSITPTGALSDLGTATAPFRELFLSGNTLHVGDVGVSKLSEGLALTYGAGNADLALRNLTAASVYAGTYLNLPETTWSDVTEKPSEFPSEWSIVGGKPSEFPSEWDIVGGKPSVFPSQWDIVANKPEITLCEEDLRVHVPVGAILGKVGNEFINDPTIKNIVGQTVNRADYIELANTLGIPTSQSSFVVPNLESSNKPNLSTVATTGSYNDLINKPTILDKTAKMFSSLIVNMWTERTSAADNSWSSVCWSPELSLFVAVAYSGTGNRVMTSPTGIKWTARTSASDNQWTSVCWSPQLSVFVAVSYTGTNGGSDRVMTSTNGTTWISRTCPINGWNAVCWSPQLSLFVAVGANGLAMTSTNGTDWIQRATPTSNFLAGICWSPELSLFVAVGNSGTGNRITTSNDGIAWTTRASPADIDWLSVCWSPQLSLFVAVSTYGFIQPCRVMTSSNGTTWTMYEDPEIYNDWRSVCWSPELSLFVAVGTQTSRDCVMSSPDGIKWSVCTTSAKNAWVSICWSPELKMFVVVGVTSAGKRVMTTTPGLPL